MKRKTPKPILNDAAREYFRQMGALGGKQRANNMSAKERKEQAQNAIKARWNKRKEK